MSRRSSTVSEPRKAARRKRSAGGGRILHLDAFSGIAGNMFLGALLDLGLSRRVLDRDLAGLGVDYKLRVSAVQRGALAARFVNVVVPGAKKSSKRFWQLPVRLAFCTGRRQHTMKLPNQICEG